MSGQPTVNTIYAVIFLASNLSGKQIFLHYLFRHMLWSHTHTHTDTQPHTRRPTHTDTHRRTYSSIHTLIHWPPSFRERNLHSMAKQDLSFTILPFSLSSLSLSLSLS